MFTSDNDITVPSDYREYIKGKTTLGKFKLEQSNCNSDYYYLEILGDNYEYRFELRGDDLKDLFKLLNRHL